MSIDAPPALPPILRMRLGSLLEHGPDPSPVLAFQLSERLEVVSEGLERLQSQLQNPPAARGDSAWVREQLRENDFRLAELEKLGMALETLHGQRAELLATLQAGASEGTCTPQAGTEASDSTLVVVGGQPAHCPGSRPEPGGGSQRLCPWGFPQHATSPPF